MTAAPDVSVVMSVHDDAPHLERTMDSVLSQEGVDLELVVVDDGSTDGSTHILRDYAVEDPRVRLLEQENRGLTEALIRACRTARARHLCRQDAGDVSHRGRLRALVDALDADESLAFVSTWTEVRGPDFEYLYTIEDAGVARTPARILRHEDGRIDLAGGPTHHGAVMMRKAAYDRVGGYRPEFYLAQDKDLWFRLAEIGTYRVIPRALYAARVLPTSRTSSYRDLQVRLRELAREAAQLRHSGESERPVLERAARLRPEPGAVAPATLAEAHYFVAEALRRNRDPRCRRYFRKALRLNPLQMKSYLRLAQAVVLASRSRPTPVGGS